MSTTPEGQLSTNNTKLKKLTNMFTQQLSPDNPFGPNYRGLDINSKMKYKYGLMKQFFKAQPQDQQMKEYQQQKFVGIIILSFVTGYYAVQLPSMLYKIGTKGSILPMKQFLMISAMCISTTCGYKISNDRYTQKVSKYFLDKYCTQAIQNGFADYQISL